MPWYRVQSSALNCGRREAEDGGDEVLAAHAEQPLSTDRQVRLLEDVPDRLLRGELVLALHAQRSDWALLAIRLPGTSLARRRC